MELYQLKIEGFSCPSIDYKILENTFKKQNIKYEISNSGKSVLFEEQLIISKDEQTLYNIAKHILKSNDEIILTHNKNLLTLKPKFYTKLFIEHRIVLDLYSDNDQESSQELSDYFKSISLHHSIDENLIFSIHAQKCLLEFNHINEIIKHINYGSSKKTEITMYDACSYSLTQIQGYQKYLNV